ncbi:MAG TPA: flagellar hook-basal body complex protein, partial [Solirubrobacteraceae bacterium]|nr:flagellar hook-basal body complex protein [Solirubrobacteraceae bacterium]
MYAAISGLDANQTMLNDTANNLANVNTIGYKSSSVTFADSLTQVIRGASGTTISNGGTNPVQIGLGVQVDATEDQMSEGSFQSTNNPLDVAIEGNGFLRVGNGTPPAAPPYTTALPSNVQYTRAGNLTTNKLGFLTTQAGQYLVGRNAVATTTEAGTTYAPGTEDSYIVIPPGSDNVSIGQDGSVSYQDENPASPTFQQQVTAGYLSLATFANESGLERL